MNDTKTARERKIDTYWNATIDTSADGKSGCSTIVSGKTLADGLANAVREGSYYVLECGYDVTAEIRELCSQCHGLKTIQAGKRVRKTIRCPACRGKGEFATVGPFAIDIHPNAKERHSTV